MIFNYLGEPWLTQFWSRQVIQSVYSGVSPQFGYSGDEDQGLMGALAVLMKIGLFSMRGGCALDPVYEISSPIFDRVAIELQSDYYHGESFVIPAEENGTGQVYIQSAELNGQVLDRPWIRHHDLVRGGRLKLELSNQPIKDWASGPQSAPPSMSKKNESNASSL